MYRTAAPTGRQLRVRKLATVIARRYAGINGGVFHMGINKDQIEGRLKEAGGKIQEAAGKAVGNTTQQVKGAVNKTAGAAQAKFGDVKSDIEKESDRDIDTRP
jgi:uncharacterized protein YjbJ (UPF0337 family)